MRITVPFSPGYTFWSPRVHSHGEKLCVVHEGKEYTRWEESLQISAKHKKIVRVEVTLWKTGEPRFRYWAVAVESPLLDPVLRGSASLVDPHSGFSTESDAIASARHWRDTEQTEFFGGQIEAFDEGQFDE